MHKLIVAVCSVLVTGLAGFSVAGNTAQDARTVRPVQVKELELEIDGAEGDELQVFLPRWENEFVEMRPANDRGQAGTWQIVMVGKSAILLNTANGETFSLEEGDEGAHWKPIPRPMGEPGRDMPRLREGDRETDREDNQKRLEELREKLRNAEGNGRERIKKAIEELENTLERAKDKRDGDRKDEPKRDKTDKESDKQDVDDMLKHVEEKITDLKEKHENSDSIKEREKLQRQIDELKEKAEGLRKDRKDR